MDLLIELNALNPVICLLIKVKPVFLLSGIIIFATMKRQYIFIITTVLLFSTAELSSQVKIYNFEQFKPLLHKSNDTTYVVNFWATWCVPCVKELPDFERINEMYKDGKFKMILVNLDFRRNLEDRVLPFMDRHQIKSEVLMLHEPDANKWIPQVYESWSGAIPATFIYNEKQGFRNFHEGSYTYDELNAIVEQIIIN